MHMAMKLARKALAVIEYKFNKKPCRSTRAKKIQVQ